MSKNSNRPNNDRNDFPVFAGILLGIVFGLALAGGIAWFVMKKNPVPTPPARETPLTNKPPLITAPDQSEKSKTSSSGDGKARFEFYKELTGKPDTSSSKKNDRHETVMINPVAPPNKPADNSTSYFLQEGAYTTMDDAEKVKAKLALIGMVATVQPANIPGKGLWYRVRMGPYKTSKDMNEALATLKLNGLNAAPIKAQ